MLFTAKDIMTTPVISVTEDATLKEAIDLFSRHKIGGVPVVDGENRVVGILTEGDIVNFSSKTHVISRICSFGWISPHTDPESIARFKKGFDLLAHTKVSLVMTRKVYTILEDAPGYDIAALMKRRKIDRVPVVDKEGHLRGIATRTNLVYFLAEGQSII